MSWAEIDNTHIDNNNVSAVLKIEPVLSISLISQVLGSYQTFLLKRYTSVGTVMYEKAWNPSLLPVPLPEVFELTRFIETSNEDPTLNVYRTNYLCIALASTTHPWASTLPGFRMNLKCSKFRKSQTKRQQTLLPVCNPQLPRPLWKNSNQRGLCITALMRTILHSKIRYFSQNYQKIAKNT